MIVCAGIVIGLLLIMSGNVELNPGPFKKCPKCESFVATRTMNCKCGHVFIKCRQHNMTESKRVAMRMKRACESVSDTVERKMLNTICMSRKRSLETDTEVLCRRQSDRLAKRQKRMLETESEAFCRRVTNKLTMKQKRMLETDTEVLCRRQSDRLAKKQKRMLETESEALCRRETNKLTMKQKRLCEADSEAFCRKEANRLNMKYARLSESEDVAKMRKEMNRLCMRAKRLSTVSLDNVIALFLSKIRCGPDYVCTVCHRMLYKSSVILFNEDKYGEIVVQNVINKICKQTSIDGRQWICSSCHNAMCRGNMPVQCKANGLNLDEIPNELNELNTLELRLVSLRIPFMKMVALPSGKQRCIHGPAVNVPSKLDNVCTLLPRMPSEASMIPLKLKRKLRYKGHYMYDYVRPDKVMTALKWLKKNNPMYSNIDINDSWINDDLIGNSEFVNPNVNNGDDFVKNVLIDNVQNSTPMSRLTERAKGRGFGIHDVSGDGNCLFHAVSYHLPNIGIQCIDASTLRSMVVEYLRANPTVNGVHYCNFMTNDDNDDVTVVWDRFLDDLANDAWADNIAIQGLSDVLSITCSIVSSENPNVTEVAPNNDDSIGTIHFGLLEQLHYVGLDKVCEQSFDESDLIDNENVHEGDQHTRQITGAPLESCMSLENPESDSRIYSVAPAEGQKPVMFMTDEHFEAMCNPCNFPYGNGTFSTDRERKLTYHKYFNQRLLDVDGRFARDLDYLFVAQYIVEAKQILDDGNHFIWR